MLHFSSIFDGKRKVANSLSPVLFTAVRPVVPRAEAPLQVARCNPGLLRLSANWLLAHPCTVTPEIVKLICDEAPPLGSHPSTTAATELCCTAGLHCTHRSS